MIAIANPGTHPELMYLASELSATNDVRYLTSASFARDSLVQRLVRAPLVRDTPLAALGRRALPAPLHARNVVRIAGASEALFLLGRKTGRAWSDGRMAQRNVAFQAGAVRWLRAHRPATLISQYTASRELFAAVGDDTLKILNYPIVHDAWMADVMEQEAAANPEWAPFLQGYRPPAEYLAMIDDEIRMADYVLIPSSFVREAFVASGVPESKLLVSNLGAVLPESSGGIVADAGGADRPLRVLYAGQVNQRKGISYLLEAVSRVPNVELRVVGHQPIGIGELIARYPRVTVLPSLARAELDREYESADLLALPSLAEGFPLVAVEAMSHGTACILTDAAAAADLIDAGISGYRVPARSTDALVRVLTEAEADRAAVVRMGAAARERARQVTWGEYGRRTAGILSSLTTAP